MEESDFKEPKPNSSQRFSRADITAFIALLVSLAALFVSILEANIMREQQDIMQIQQKASVLRLSSIRSEL